MSQRYEFAILQPILVIFWPLYNYLSQNLGADCHFVVLKLSKSELDQRLQHKSKTFLFPLFLNLEEKSWKLMTQKWAFSYHFFANYMKIFHKTEVQMVILKCLVCLNLNWIKSYDVIGIKMCVFSMSENASF